MLNEIGNLFQQFDIALAGAFFGCFGAWGFIRRQLWRMHSQQIQQFVDTAYELQAELIIGIADEIQERLFNDEEDEDKAE